MLILMRKIVAIWICPMYNINNIVSAHTHTRVSVFENELNFTIQR